MRRWRWVNKRDEPHNRGDITTEYTFWCGKCIYWEQISAAYNKNEAIKEARSQGWKLTKKDGWVCPWCATGTKRYGPYRAGW